jgi:hypothetical protein
MLNGEWRMSEFAHLPLAYLQTCKLETCNLREETKL